jgi:uncharacterized protein (TIGR00369 family)
MSLSTEIDDHCFVCGPSNAAGLQARFECAEGRATGQYTPRAEHQGYTGISHGGVLAALLDETMVYASVTLGHWVTTAELTVRYNRPAQIGAPLLLSGEVTSHKRRLIECRAEIRDEAGELIAAATGKLLQGRALHDHERRDPRTAAL